MTAVLMLGVLISGMAGALPVVASNDYAYPIGYAGHLLCIPVLLFLMFTNSDFGRCLGWQRPIVFLDKVCIHQTDCETQRLGIERLGAFLCHSSSFLVLYTDLYLQRLWTVYELASFVALHPMERMTFMPVSFGIVIVMSMVVFQLSNCVIVLIYFSVQMDVILQLVDAFAFALMLIFRWWGRALASMNSRFDNFRLDQCQCTCEEDRPMVHRNIVRLMKATGHVPTDVSDQAALCSFEVLVRTSVRDTARARIGNIGLRFDHVIFEMAVMVYPRLIDTLAGVGHGMPFREGLVHCAVASIYVWSLCPQQLAALSIIARTRLDLKGYRNHVYAGGLFFLWTIPTLLEMFVLEQLRARALVSDAWLAVASVGCAWAASPAERYSPGQLRQQKDILRDTAVAHAQQASSKMKK
eukprot:CAMPEP_0117484232 /NCGR_PEP_ID=MMETSP0784-20121206/14353_1 /TAXON_ID=39447 /ORGANISM="" /LENGTH=410 /DNA_ID=CAMNT_0005278801 /DNA_START=491 /DNA_END=1724 /DNA_ORIENTATION=+